MKIHLCETAPITAVLDKTQIFTPVNAWYET